MLARDFGVFAGLFRAPSSRTLGDRAVIVRPWLTSSTSESSLLASFAVVKRFRVDGLSTAAQLVKPWTLIFTKEESMGPRLRRDDE